jgi:hypothetical protein
MILSFPMIDRKSLLMALQRWVKKFENDLRLRCKEVPELDDSLRNSYGRVKDACRTAENYETWRDGRLSQAAVSWVLACVFVRFLEDNELLDQPWIAGAGNRRTEAEHIRDRFFSQHPTLSDRDYLQHIFTEVGKLPGMADLFDRRQNPLWGAGVSGDAASEFIAFWRNMEYDFADPALDTRFLGDLYQDLSEAARKQFALLQTPAFVAEFILDRTLEPAIETFGYEHVRMIDPACGSGHFILGGFARLLCRWQSGHPELNEREVVMRALEGVAGVDINPFAIAIARFRLLLLAWQACGITRLRAAPDFRVNLAVGDSLLHGRRFRGFESYSGPRSAFDIEEIFRDELKHHYEVEDPEALRRILGRQYHAVVGNPPYITVKDRALSELYRARYSSCHREYSLSIPFMERFFDLAVKGNGMSQQAAGFVGKITANSFMKRELGKKLVESFLPKCDLTHVIDTDKAHIPGHATGTVIVFGRNQTPHSSVIRTVMGIKKQEPRPEVPEEGLVWHTILKQLDVPGSQNEWVTVADSPRSNFQKHPWSIGGGGAAELKAELDTRAKVRLGTIALEIGSTAIIGEDDGFVIGKGVTANRLFIEHVVTLVAGNAVRDWSIVEGNAAIWIYDQRFAAVSLNKIPYTHMVLWPSRRLLEERKRFSVPVIKCGLKWYEWRELYATKLKTPLTICWGEVATHNHFVLDGGGKVFNRTAPVIKLKSNATDSDYLGLLGVLNSSTICFFLKQVCHDKGAGGIGGGIASEEWEHRFAFNATQIDHLPIPAHTPRQLPTAIVKYNVAVQANSPAATLESWCDSGEGELRKLLHSARDVCAGHRHKLIAWQEELDWQIYEAFGLVDSEACVSLPEGKGMDMVYSFGLELGERAFEIVLARRMAAGQMKSTWFERHASTPITELPHHWPTEYRELVERRIRRIESDPNIRLIEQPEYKRRWNTEPWDDKLTRALRDWVLNRLETVFFHGERILGGDRVRPAPEAVRFAFPGGREPRLTSTRQLADAVSLDADFLRVAPFTASAKTSIYQSWSENSWKKSPRPSCPYNATKNPAYANGRNGNRHGTCSDWKMKSTRDRQQK